MFVVAGLAWLAYTLFVMVAGSLGDCGGDESCEMVRRYSSGLNLWRGLAIALLLILAYLGFRAFNRDDHV